MKGCNCRTEATGLIFAHNAVSYISQSGNIREIQETFSYSDFTAGCNLAKRTTALSTSYHGEGDILLPYHDFKN